MPAHPGEPAVVARGLRYTYPSGNGLHHADLRLMAGGMTAVTGPSGSGKSTLLALLGTILAPAEGTLALAGRDTGALGSAERDAIRAETIGIVLQDLGLLPFLNAWQNVAAAFGPRLARHESAARNMLDRLGLDRLADSPATDLSGGERQRVGVARAAVKRPALILADEPTANLDDVNAGAVLDALATAAGEGAAVLVATHDRRAVARCADVLHMNGGRLTGTQPAGPKER
ncbi:ABC transporter ATP-binding protein [Amycolatopsis aidingensis]|uniref:ABC transporter ATP-binding protein n=1 Tax=Amycolatopsis aidingensis TaxID=2842453 RepID=UPI001C0C54A1|nr:ATP-binding cassette domain-containing protein [Amycolatopsis aidingensis]